MSWRTRAGTFGFRAKGLYAIEIYRIGITQIRSVNTLTSVAPQARSKAACSIGRAFQFASRAVQWFWRLTGSSPAAPGCAMQRGAAV